MKTSMMKHNWLRLLCVLGCLSFTAGMSTGAFAAKPVDNDGDGVKSNTDCNDNDPDIWDLNSCGNCAPEPSEGCGTCTPTPGEETQELTCDDNIDNDCDTYIDSADPDCATGGACSGYTSKGACNADTSCEWQGNPKNGSCVDAAACTITEDPEVSCSDGSDNDCDGLTDGADSDCQAGAEVCDDGIDNDSDNLTDCADPDCGGLPACSAGNKLTANRVIGTVLGIGPNDGLWDATAAATYGMAWRDDINDTCPPNNNCSGQQPTLTVKAIHDGINIAFLMSWNDASQSSEVYQPSEFGDRAVIMLNANRICQMGSPNNPTNMWFWNAADKTQGQYGSVQNLLGGGIGTVTHTPDADGKPGGDDNIQVVSYYSGSEWQVVMSRPLAAIDAADQFAFTLGVTTEVAFALYDGKHKQRNGAKWISGRESMDIAP